MMGFSALPLKSVNTYTRIFHTYVHIHFIVPSQWAVSLQHRMHMPIQANFSKSLKFVKDKAFFIHRMQPILVPQHASF